MLLALPLVSVPVNNKHQQVCKTINWEPEGSTSVIKLFVLKIVVSCTVTLPELSGKCPDAGRVALGQDGDEEEEEVEEASGKLCLTGGGGGGCDGGAVLKGSSAGKAGKDTRKDHGNLLHWHIFATRW